MQLELACNDRCWNQQILASRASKFIQQAQQLNMLVRLLTNRVMEYEWGSVDPNCLIATLTNSPRSHYAELWMGTHPNGPSLLTPTLSLLDQRKHHGKPPLPFLFKMLNISRSLSIQLHPNKEQAEQLRATYPQMYPDDNAKPEMFFTLGDFQCLIGLQDPATISKLLALKSLSSLSIAEDTRSTIREIMGLHQSQQLIDSLSLELSQQWPEKAHLLQRLSKEYPGDPGAIVACFMKYRKIQGGKCFAIAPGVPHAYLRGDCLQIMRSSDNVVRLGLTPKVKDLNTMMSIIDVHGQVEEVHPIGQHYSWNNLSLTDIFCPEWGGRETAIRQDSIGIVLEGEFLESKEARLKRGAVFYLEEGKYNFEGEGRMFIGSSE